MTTSAAYSTSNPFIPTPTNYAPGTPISPTGYVNTLFGTYPSTSIPAAYQGNETCGYPVGAFAHPNPIGAGSAYGTYPVFQPIPFGANPYGVANPTPFGAWPAPWHSPVSPWQSTFGTPFNTIPQFLGGGSPLNTFSPFSGHGPFHSPFQMPQFPGHPSAFTPGIVPNPWNPAAAWFNGFNPVGFHPYGAPFFNGHPVSQFAVGVNPVAPFQSGFNPSFGTPGFSPFLSHVPGGYVSGFTPFHGPGTFPFAFNPFTNGTPFAQPWQVQTNGTPGYPVETNINGQRRNGLNRDAA